MSEIKIQMRLDWSSERPDAQLANTVQVQRFGSDLILSLGIALPPFALTGMSQEEITDYLETHKVPVRKVRRIVLPLPVAQELVSQIKGNLPGSSADDAEEQSGGPAQNDKEAS